MLIPFTTTVVPVWKLRVINLEGNFCPRSQVNQGWGHYSLELEDIGGSDIRFTDDEGYVEFPERTIKANLIWRILAPTIAFIMQIAHGSFGIKGYVFSTGMIDGPFINYKPGKPIPDKIIVDRCYFRSN
jgi:hypothetical protein